MEQLGRMFNKSEVAWFRDFCGGTGRGGEGDGGMEQQMKLYKGGICWFIAGSFCVVALQVLGYGAVPKAVGNI